VAAAEAENQRRNEAAAAENSRKAEVARLQHQLSAAATAVRFSVTFTLRHYSGYAAEQNTARDSRSNGGLGARHLQSLVQPTRLRAAVKKD
jgi:hypothetical protein